MRIVSPDIEEEDADVSDDDSNLDDLLLRDGG